MMTKAILFVTIAAIGNATFVYGQRAATATKNPFIFMLGAVIICTILFFISTLFFNFEQNLSYISSNLKNIVISGTGFFITFLGFYLLYSGFGASSYIIYAVISIVTTSIGVGVLCYKQPFNLYHSLALFFAIITISFYCYGEYVSKRDSLETEQTTPQS